MKRVWFPETTILRLLPMSPSAVRSTWNLAIFFLPSHSIVLGIDPKASYILGRHYITELYHNRFCFETRFPKVLKDHKSKAHLPGSSRPCELGRKAPAAQEAAGWWPSLTPRCYAQELSQLCKVSSCHTSSLSAVVARPEPGLPPSAGSCVPGVCISHLCLNFFFKKKKYQTETT